MRTLDLDHSLSTSTQAVNFKRLVKLQSPEVLFASTAPIGMPVFIRLEAQQGIKGKAKVIIIKVWLSAEEVIVGS